MADLAISDVKQIANLSGTNVAVFVDGKKVAYFENVKVDEKYNQTNLDVIGQFFPINTMPTKFDGTLSGKLWLITDPADELKITLPDLTEILSHKGSLFEFRQQDTDTPILRAICKLDSRTTTFSSGEAVSADVNFKIIRVQHTEAYN